MPRRAIRVSGFLLAAIVLAAAGRARAQAPETAEPSESRPGSLRVRDLDEVIRRWHAPNLRLRLAATRAVVQRWGDWSPADLARMEEVRTGGDADAASGAEAALSMVNRARELADGLTPGARRIASLVCPVEDDRAAVAVGLARKLAGEEVITAGDLERIEALARVLAPEADLRSLPPDVLPARMTGSLKQLRKLVRSPESRIRAGAIRAIGRRGEPHLASLVGPGLADPFPCVRRAAGIALPRLWSADRKFRLEEWLDPYEPEPLAVELVEGLIRIGPGPLTDCLEPMLSEPEPILRRTAVHVLASFREPRRAAQMFPFLGDPNPLLVEAAVDSVGDMRPDGSIEVARRMMNDPRPRQREFGARLAGRLGTRELWREAATCLEDLFPRVRAASAEAVGFLGRVELVPEVIRASLDEDCAVREAAVLSLGRLGSEEAVERIFQALDDPETSVRVAAARALGVSRAPGAGERLRHLAREDPSAPVAAAATRALGLLGDEEDLEVLVRQLSDATPAVRAAAADAIALAGARQFGPQVAALTIEGEPAVARAAVRALDRVAAPPDRWILWVSRVGDLDSGRCAAALAIANLYTPPVAPAERRAILRKLNLLADDLDEDVCCAAGIGQLRLGRLAVPAQRRLLEVTNGADPSIAADLRASLLEALLLVHEPEIAAKLAQDLTPDRDIATVHDLAAAFAASGLRLESHERVIFEGRVPAGLRVTPAWLLWRAGLRGAYVVEGNRVRVLTPGLAVAHWRGRLAAMKEK